jgi:hypothetical protein
MEHKVETVGEKMEKLGNNGEQLEGKNDSCSRRI